MYVQDLIDNSLLFVILIHVYLNKIHYKNFMTPTKSTSQLINIVTSYWMIRALFLDLPTMANATILSGNS